METKKNMERYLRMATPPDDALKTIKGGRLKGKTDINPQWRIETITAEYGEYGEGWYYEVLGREFKDAPNNEIAVFVDILLHVKINGAWLPPIPASGGSMFYSIEQNGVYVSDEAVKMATTDALSVAMKVIGVAADIYRGFVIGDSKYGRTPVKGGEKTKGNTLPLLTKETKTTKGNNVYDAAVRHLQEGGDMADIITRYSLDEETNKYFKSLCK